MSVISAVSEESEYSSRHRGRSRCRNSNKDHAAQLFPCSSSFARSSEQCGPTALGAAFDTMLEHIVQPPAIDIKWRIGQRFVGSPRMLLIARTSASATISGGEACPPFRCPARPEARSSWPPTAEPSSWPDGTAPELTVTPGLRVGCDHDRAKRSNQDWWTVIHVNRAKNGEALTHPLSGRRLKRE